MQSELSTADCSPATVPPTIALARKHFGLAGPVVFGWVFASHQVGAAVMAFAAGVLRDRTGAYDSAFWVGGVLCLTAAGLSLLVAAPRARGSRPGAGTPAAAPR